MSTSSFRVRRLPRLHLYASILSAMTFACLASMASAQDNCENRLKVAIKKYQIGLINEAINLIDTCLNNASLTKEQKIGAYVLLGQAYIALDYPDKAENAIKKLLELNPSYTPDPATSPTLFMRYIEKHAPLKDLFGTYSPIYRKSRSSFSLPVELGFGYVRRNDPQDKADDAFFIRLNPTLGLGKQKKVRLGLANGILYTNSKTVLLGGGRISFPLGVLSDFALDALQGTRGHTQVGGALFFNIFTIQYGIRVAYDPSQSHRLVEISFGTILWYK